MSVLREKPEKSAPRTVHKVLGVCPAETTVLVTATLVTHIMETVTARKALRVISASEKLAKKTPEDTTAKRV